MRLLELLTAILTWLTADPAAIDAERPRAEAAVAAARASLLSAAPSPPAPSPPPAPAPCTRCGGKGYIVHGDGHRTVCPCRTATPCATGTCRPGA